MKMKKFFSYIIVVFTAVLLTGCASNTITVNNDEVIKFNGGAITKSDAYNQMITTAGYDTTFTLVKGMLVQVDMQLLEKEESYKSKIKEEDIQKQYDDIVKQAEGVEKAFSAIASQLGISVTNEQEAKNAIRYTMLVQQAVIDKGSTDKELESAYEQQYGEKVYAKYAIFSDKTQADAFQKELVSGSIKIEDVVSQYTAHQQAQQQQSASAQEQQQVATAFVYNTKYTIDAVAAENTQAIPKKAGSFKEEDENILFNRSSKDVWLAPFEFEVTQSQSANDATPKTVKYAILMPYKYEDATKQLDDAVKAELKEGLANSKLQDPKEIEKIMREYRKAKGFEIQDAQLKKAFDAYQTSIDTPSTSNQSGLAGAQQVA